MPRFQIAVAPGDGIGPEVVASSLEVLSSVQTRLQDVSFDCIQLALGAGEYLAHGDPLPAAAIERMKAADAILVGAMGLPNVRWPNGVEITPQIDIREKLDLYNGIRPIKLFHAQHTPLKGFSPGTRPIDLVIVRENCEGLFSDRLTPRPIGRDYETDTLKITRHGAMRVCRVILSVSVS